MLSPTEAFKGQFNKFLTSSCFLHLNQLGPSGQWVKLFFILIWLSYSNFIFGWTNKNPHIFLWHCPFTSLCKSLKKWLLTSQGHHQWLPVVWYCGEIDSRQYDTAWRLTLCSMILREIPNNAGDSKIFENLRETLIKIKSMLTHWSVAQAGWNDEKRMWLDNLVGLSL